MSSYDPRQLRVILDDLQDYLGIWSGVATDTLNEADYSQTITREHVNRAIHYTSMVKSQAEKDVLQVNSKQSEYDDVSAKCEEAVATAQDTLGKAQKTFQEAQQTFNYWQSELKIALAWLERAKIRLAKAKQVYETARLDAEKAKKRLEQAKKDFDRCQKDDNRSNCRDEVRRVELAVDNYRDCLRNLEIAQIELNAAIADYNLAVERVNCCQQAVAYATKALTYATNSQLSATNGERMAGLSLEYAKEVQKFFELAKKKSEEQINVSERMNIIVREAIEDTDQAQLHLAQADSVEESAQGYYYRSDMELASRIDSLIQLNRPLPLSTTLDASSKSKADKGNTRQSDLANSKWVNTGIENIAIKEMPDPEGITGISDFHKVSMEDMKQGILRLQEMYPTIESGQGTNSDYWAELDAEKGLDYANGYRRVYDAFFGHDAIKITYDDKVFDIINGRHRIWLAKRMGIDFLPMNITRKINN